MDESMHGGVQVKVCGLTAPDEAAACAGAGADAIGLVFYPPSPRFVDDGLAREISSSLPGDVDRIGVFVDESFPAILRRIEGCGLSGVQLHGRETPEIVEILMAGGVRVIKSIFARRSPGPEDASLYAPTAYLVESGEGPLPGGNAVAWNWGEARKRMGRLPCILAGGLTPGNVTEAIRQFSPDAVDVSSGVEYAPGRKDIARVREFLQAVRRAELLREPGRIFQ
ncbi:MAG: phosphoribosylanthranilate isomerase [Desulfobacteraceae bacterium]|nr:phosphoribosylanthranilate isomerase [Desulfobacteraceae bacterium]